MERLRGVFRNGATSTRPPALMYLDPRMWPWVKKETPIGTAGIVHFSIFFLVPIGFFGILFLTHCRG